MRPGAALLLAMASIACLAATPESNADETPRRDLVAPTAVEMSASAQWMAANFWPDAETPPFSFWLGGRRSQDLLKTWETERTTEASDAARTRETITYTDLETGLEARCVIVRYNDFPTVEWTVYFKNNGASDTPVLDRIQALDVRFQRDEADEFLLHHAAGSAPGPAAYAPIDSLLGPGAVQRVAAAGGRPTNTQLAYMNLEWGGQGIAFAVGWPGQWAMEFAREGRTSLRVEAGQEWTHLRLHPGEEIRTPLMVLQFWQGGDWMRAQNIWRRWMIQHNLPRPGGQLPPPMYSGQSGYTNSWMYKATEENQKEFIDRFVDLEIDVDHWWMDTGWYMVHGVPESELTDDQKALREDGRLWEQMGIWQYNGTRFPNGIRAISDHAHKHRIKTILWFEPERVVPAAWLSEEHPEWCLEASTHPHHLLNLGDPDALDWAIDRIDEVLSGQAIDVFRSDFNMDPLDHWRQNDTPDRQGMTENLWVQGYLAFWDGLLDRNPNLLIDSCASGGRRNDLETMRRAVPLWKSDYAIEPIGMQSQTHGLALWLPYFGNAGGMIDPYMFRSNMFPAVTQGAWEDRTETRDVRRDDLDYDLLRTLIAQWRQVSPYYYGDFYPLTPHTLAKDAWIAWQFHTPDRDEGMVQAFRRDDSPNDSAQYRLRGLDPNARYLVTNVDEDGGRQRTGRALMEDGLTVVLWSRPAAALVTYKRVDDASE